jgi:hypothetical protein
VVILTNIDARRGLRSIVQSIMLIGLLWIIWRLAGPGDVPWLIGVIAISVLGNQVENGVRTFKVDLRQGTMDMDADPGQAAQSVADVAQDQADTIKGATP